MEGRKENEKKVFKQIEKIIEDTPSYMHGYWDMLKADEKSYTTQLAYIKYVLDFLTFVDKELKLDITDINCFKEIKTSNINAYTISLVKQGNSIKSAKLHGVKNFFNYLINDGYIEMNPCDRIKFPKIKEEHKITSLTKEEVEIIKNNIYNGVGSELTKQRQRDWVNRDYAIVMIGLCLGLRVTSLTEINVSDINFDDNEIKIVEKGNKTRFVSFGENLKEIILKWVKDRTEMLEIRDIETDALFITRQMKRMTSRSVYAIVEKYTYNIDKHISPHKLRSTCATNLYNNTGDIYLTAYQLGHSSVETTKRYAKISDENKKKAAQVMEKFLF